VTDLISPNSSFCEIETIWVNPETKTEVVAYRMRLQLSDYNKRPLATDRLFLRVLIRAFDVDNNPIVGFMNVQTALIASSIRCGSAVVVLPAEVKAIAKDPVRLALYSGIALLPMQEDSTGAPLLDSSIRHPFTTSTPSNLRARSIIDGVITITLLAEENVFSPLDLRSVMMVDLISIHVRDDDLHEKLQSLVRTGEAYTTNESFTTSDAIDPQTGEIESTYKRIMTSTVFDTACGGMPDHCARRNLMRAGTVLLPQHVRVAVSVKEDTVWFKELFEDDTASPVIAETFTQNAYNVFAPTDRYRRVVWVANTYEWPNTPQAGLQDHTLLLASFDIM
jgi:hypothetical protein